MIKVFTNRWKQIRWLWSQLSWIVNEIVICHGARETQNESENGGTRENVSSSNSYQLTPIDGTKIYIQTLERSFTDWVRTELDNVVAAVENCVHDCVLIGNQNQDVFAFHRLNDYEAIDSVLGVFSLESWWSKIAKPFLIWILFGFQTLVSP